MQKWMPLFLVLVLAVTAGIFSMRTKRFSQAAAQYQQPVSATVAAELPAKTPPAAAASPRVKVEPKPWPQAKSDIAVDPSATFGTLENGMRYIIYPNSEPPKRVSFRLHIAAGSLMEADDQQGVAHFLEHMVFNGSKNYAAAELVPRMQRLGISFGAHANAYTSFDETVYMLDLPDLSAETLNLGFTVMRDFGDGALLALPEIEKERGVILSEKISRDSVQYRLMQQQFSKLLPDSLVARRFPIGQESVIRSAPRERFLDLYNRFYTPERMTFIVVGDIDPKVMQAQIESQFASMTNPPVPGKNPDMGVIKQPEGIEAATFADKELTSTEVSLILTRPYQIKADDAATRSANLKLDLANSMLGRRLERLAKIAGSAIASGTVSKSILFNYAELGSIDITAADDRWKECVPVLEQEFRRALEHGFTDSELTEATSNLLNIYQQQVNQKASRKSEGIATVLAKSINDGAVFSAPETDLEIARNAIGTITCEQCHQAFKSFWDAAGYHLVFSTKDKPEGSEKELAALFEDSRGTPVQAPAARSNAAFAYTNFGKAGSVTSRTEVADLGITQLVFANQVRLNLKATDFEKGKIRLLARVGSGKLTQPRTMPMLDNFASAIFEGGGLGKHSSDELQQVLAGKNVSSALTIGEDAFVFSGTTTPTDFSLQTQLMCASLMDPGYREEALWQFQKTIPVLLQQLKYTPAGPQQELEAWLYNGDSRFTIAPQAQLAGYSLADAKNWLTPELSKGYLELTIVGDFKVDEILPNLLATFGALPNRAAAAPALTAARQIAFPAAPAAKTFTYDSKISQAMATVIWKTSGLRGNQKEFRRFNVLAGIYGDRLREEIREKLGASYSPNAGATGSEVFEDRGYIIGQSIGKPEDLELLLTTMTELANNFATDGATADEFDRTIKPILGQLSKSARDNSYWLGTVMSQCQQDPARLELARNRNADYHAITLEEVNQLAKKYLVTGNALRVAIKPASVGQ
jgi:zinc protease